MSKILLCFALFVLAEVRGGADEGVQELPKSIFSTIQSFVQGLYQDFVTRQQSIANLLSCGNCVNEGWDAIMTAVANVPGLEWSYKPQSDGRPPNFFTALNQDGAITGFGGSIIDNKPVVEFVFDQTGQVRSRKTVNTEFCENSRGALCHKEIDRFPARCLAQESHVVFCFCDLLETRGNLGKSWQQTMDNSQSHTVYLATLYRLL